jgi:hypothetical protein
MTLTLIAVDEPRNPTPAGMMLLARAHEEDGGFLTFSAELGTARLLIEDGWATLDRIGYSRPDILYLIITDAGRRALAEAQREIETPRERVA